MKFPPLWTDCFDHFLPSWVKARFSPDERWKKQPFSQEDVRFFSKSIRELSELLSLERTSGGKREFPDYFQHEKFRSAYFFYFLPFQAGKFFTLFEENRPILIEALRSAQKQNRRFRVFDLGAGPGTASLALLLWIFSMDGFEDVKLELVLNDTNAKILKEGETFLRDFLAALERREDQVLISTHQEVWWKLPTPLEHDLALLGHVLNESSSTPEQNVRTLELLLSQNRSAGVLILEPASRSTAQKLARVRDALIESRKESKRETLIYGPCLHSLACPLAEGRDWCHASLPIEVPGKTYAQFTRAVNGPGSERKWLKMSYLWFAGPIAPQGYGREARRILSEPIPQGPKRFILLCEPNEPRKQFLSPKERAIRGDVYWLKSAPKNPSPKGSR